MTATVDEAEVDKFSRMAANWWDEAGTSGPLHRLNPARMAYIRQQVERHFSDPSPRWEREGTHPDKDGKGEGNPNLPPSPARPDGRSPSPIGERVNLRPFTDLAIADIGCGGGIVCEPLAKLGARVTGIDASLEAIDVAKAHASEAGLMIDYRAKTAEQLALEGAKFDIVLALEVIEHVADVPGFIAALKALLKPNGMLILSTPNRTAKSFAAVIVGAEYVMRWLPRGTHDWRRFLRPSELSRLLRAQSMVARDVTGIIYDPLKQQFTLVRDNVSVNYLMTCFESQ